MKFKRFTNWAEISECGGYTVAASRCDGRYKFQAWRRPPPLSHAMAVLLGTHNRAQDARELCELDARLRAEAAAA